MKLLFCSEFYNGRFDFYIVSALKVIETIFFSYTELGDTTQKVYG